MKKLLSILLLVSLLISFNTSAYAVDGNDFEISDVSMLLSSMSDGQLLFFIADKGIVIPDDLKNTPELTQFIKSVITQVEISPGSPLPYNYTVTRDFAEQIKEAVNNYYKVNVMDNITSSYTLQDSVVHGSWSESFLNYNCYGYAINTRHFVNPGHYSGRSFSMSMSISQMADNVVSDLDVLGFWAVKTSTRPTSLASWEYAVAIRKGSIDYHLMRFSASNWLHKPGNTAILRWLSSDPGGKIWTNEHSFRGVSYPSNTTYNSSIVYVRYWRKDGPGPQSLSEIFE